MKVSPGCSSAKNTAWFAWAPECGCTLAKPQSNSRLARSMARVFGDVDIFAAAVIAPAGIALGIFVGQHRALRLQHRLRDDVLRGDQLDLFLLPEEFASMAARLRVGLRQASVKKSGPTAQASRLPQSCHTAPIRLPL